MPVTVYDEGIVASRDATDMSLRSGEGLTYMHYRGTPLWPYGFGLAYTNWSAPTLTVAAAAGAGAAAAEPREFAVTTDALAAAWVSHYSAQGGLDASPLATLSVHFTNEGTRSHDIVVLVFATLLSPPEAAGALPPPIRQLVGFARSASVATGESRAVAVGLAPLPLCTVDANGTQAARSGVWRLAATGDGVRFVNTTLRVTGPARTVLTWPEE